MKPENILLDSDYNIKIADFGLAGIMTSSTSKFRQCCGSPHYVAPEVLRAKQYDGQRADVWSLGVVAFVLATGTLPFGAGTTDRSKVLEAVMAGMFAMPAFVDEDLAALIRMMINVSRTLTNHTNQ